MSFARGFVAAGGVQIPGRPEATDEAEALAERLLAALAERAWQQPRDRNLQREIDRARIETRWTLAQDDPKVVGMLIRLPEAAYEDATADALSHESHGFGPGVYGKADIVVLQPAFDGAWFQPVLEDEIEC